MIKGLSPIPIKELKALSSGKLWEIEGFLDNLPSSTPIKGTVSAEHQGNTLKVIGELHTFITLICDRCLIEYSKELKVSAEELIFLGDTSKEEKHFKERGAPSKFMDFLNPLGSFDPKQWCFEQLYLQMPLLNICGSDCTAPLDLNNQKYIF